MKHSILIALLLLLGANVASAQRSNRHADERYERQYSKGERKAYKAQHRQFKHERRAFKRGGHPHGRRHGFKGRGRRCHPHHHRRHGGRR